MADDAPPYPMVIVQHSLENCFECSVIIPIDHTVVQSAICAMCSEPYIEHESIDGDPLLSMDTHSAVKIRCGHVFGSTCLFNVRAPSLLS